MTTRDARIQLRTVGETADELHVHPETIYRAIRNGDLEAVRFGRLVRIREDTIARITQPEKRP